MKEISLVDGKTVQFNISKELKDIRVLGTGGTGDTHLFYDEIAEKYFAIKKFVPKGSNDSEDCYKRFVEEIKILMDISHKNIVRIYNYYLYPKNKTGYIQMEYVEGKSIDKFVPSKNKSLDDLFVDTIDAFCYLESKGILHRDIRPSNFLINEDDELKIIDFGFGKKYDTENIDENSVLLDWPGTQKPEEIIVDKKYDVRTEIYYLGVLFKNIINNIDGFSYVSILEKMCYVQTSLRYQSFNEIKDDLSKSLFSKINFTENDKTIYKNFSSQLSDSITRFIDNRVFENDINLIMKNLEKVIESSSLEDIVQGNNKVISCFVKSNYSYIKENIIFFTNLLDFYKMMLNMSNSKKEIIIKNIQSRLSIKEIEYRYDDELPF